MAVWSVCSEVEEGWGRRGGGGGVGEEGWWRLTVHRRQTAKHKSGDSDCQLASAADQTCQMFSVAHIPRMPGRRER